MPSRSKTASRARAVMTLAEILVGLIVASILMGALYLLFFRYIGISLKGEDTITSVREAMITLEGIRKEMMMARSVASPTLIVTNGEEEVDLSTPANVLCLNGANGTIRYDLATDTHQRLFLEKTVVAGGQVIERKPLNLDRLKGFTTYWIQNLQTVGAGRVSVKSLFIGLDLQGSVGQQTATRIRVHTLVTPAFNSAENSAWP